MEVDTEVGFGEWASASEDFFFERKGGCGCEVVITSILSFVLLHAVFIS